MDTTLLQFVTQNNLLDSIELSDILPFDMVEKTDKSVDGRIKALRHESSNISLQSIYTDNLISEGSDIQFPKLYNNLIYRTKVNIGEVPMSISGRAVMSDGKYQNRLSNISFDFDYRSFLDGYKSKFIALGQSAKDSLMGGKIDKLYGTLDDFELPELSENELTIVQNELRYQILQKVISHPKYVELMSRKDSIFIDSKGRFEDKQKAIDSLGLSSVRAKRDSILTKAKLKRTEALEFYKAKYGLVDSLRLLYQSKRDSIENYFNSTVRSSQKIYETKRKEIDSVYLALKVKSSYVVDSLKVQANGIQQEYLDTWEARKEYYGDSLHAVKEKFENHAHGIKESLSQDSIKHKLSSNPDAPLLHRILANTTKLSLGQSYLDDSWYTVSSLPIFGFHYGYQSGKWAGELAIGRQTFNNSFSPLWSSSLFGNLKGGKISFVKLGRQLNEKTNLSLGYTSFSEEGQVSSGVVLLPEKNQVYSLSVEHKLSDVIAIKGEIAQSTNQIAVIILQKTRVGNSLAGEWTIKGGFSKLDIEIGYFFVGADYHIGTNPFLLSNRKGLVTKITTKDIKNLDVGLDFKIGTSVDKTSELHDDQRNFQLLGNMNWHVNSSWNLSVQVSPNTFKHFGSGNITTTGSNTIYSIQATNNGQIGSIGRSTTVGLTNFTSDIQYVDTLLSNKTDQLFIQNELRLNDRGSIGAMFMYGVNSSDLEDSDVNENISFFSQLDYSHSEAKFTGQLGLQLLRTFVSPRLFAGAKIGFNLMTESNFTLGFSGTYQVPITMIEGNDNRFYGSIEIGKKF